MAPGSNRNFPNSYIFVHVPYRSCRCTTASRPSASKRRYVISANFSYKKYFTGGICPRRLDLTLVSSHACRLLKKTGVCLPISIGKLQRRRNGEWSSKGEHRRLPSTPVVAKEIDRPSVPQPSGVVEGRRCISNFFDPVGCHGFMSHARA